MLNNNPNPLRAAYPELDGRTAMEALQSPAIAGAAAGLPVFTGSGGVAEARTAEEALAALGLAHETGTWEPVLRDSVGPITYTYDTQTASYVRLGSLCYVSLYIAGLNVTAVHDGAQAVRPAVAGLPYTGKTYISLPVRNNGLTIAVVRPVEPYINGNEISVGAAYTGWKVGYLNPATDIFLIVCLYEIRG